MATVGIKFLYNFAVSEYDFVNPGSNVISVTSEYGGDHGKVNLTTTPLRETFRTGPDISGFIEIVIQANDTTVTPDVFALLNHNLTELAVVQVQASQTTDFSASTTVPMIWNKKHMVLLQSFGAPYNYYKFRILDPSNACGFLEIGRIVAGESFTFTNNEDISDDISIRTQDLAYKTNTEGFFRAFNERVKVDTLSIRFQKLDTRNGGDINYAGMMKMFDRVGETYPLLTILDPADQNFYIHWGVIDSLPTRSYSINRYVDMSLTMQEVY